MTTTSIIIEFSPDHPGSAGPWFPGDEGHDLLDRHYGVTHRDQGVAS